MAHILASEFDKKCAFVDLDLQSGDASFYLSSGANQHSLGDLTRQIDRLDAQLLASCLHAVTPRLNLLAAPHALESAMAISAQDIEKVLTLVRSLHEHVVVDLPRHLNALSLKVMDMADVVYIVMQNKTPDVRNAQRLVKTLRALGLNDSKLRLLVNRYAPGGWVSLAELEQAVGLKVHQTIPSNPQWVGESLHTGQPLSEVNDHNAVMHALRQTTGALLDTALPKPRHWMQRWMGQAA
jgi:pilus assembly protein CpaE